MFGKVDAFYFYPRPPGGGRHFVILKRTSTQRFLSTPSGWRATCHVHVERVVLKISIHALRVEGDFTVAENEKTPG